jgi:protease-4
MATSTSSKWFWGIFISLIFIGLIFIGISFLVLATVIKSEKVEFRGTGDKIAIVDVNDIIMSSERTVREIKKYREDKSIKAIILRVNSPGGGVAASQEIYEEVRKTRESGKPIVVSMASIAASGAYYISCGSSLIVANPGTLTGSIGVIAEFITIKELADKLGIQQNVFKSGELKDAGNPFRNMTEKDKAYFQDVVDNSFGQFLGVVSKERKINIDTLKQYANGRVFTGLQAKKIGLVDSIGTFEDAIRMTAELAGIKGEPSIVRESKRFSIFERIIGTSMEDIKDLKDRFFEEPILQYKFTP